MIRPITCICFLLACGSGLYLYQAKHRVQLLDRQIEDTVQATDKLREQSRVLHAEWTLLNDPQRLQALADQFLALKTVQPSQFASMADLDSRLPAVPPTQPPPPHAWRPVPPAGASRAASRCAAARSRRRCHLPNGRAKPTPRQWLPAPTPTPRQPQPSVASPGAKSGRTAPARPHPVLARGAAGAAARRATSYRTPSAQQRSVLPQPRHTPVRRSAWRAAARPLPAADAGQRHRNGSATAAEAAEP